MSRKLPAPSAPRRAFLEHVAATGSPYEAARRSGFAHEQAAELFESDANFAEAWQLAHVEAAAALDNEVRRRALEVIDQPLFHRSGQPVLYPDGTPVTRRRYNDRRMILMLKFIDQH